MDRGGRRILWALLAGGTAIRLVLAFSFYGVGFDIDSQVLVADLLADRPLDLYAQANLTEIARWPYPPGFFPFLLGADGISGATGLPFHGVVQLPAIAADAGIAWLVQDFLRHRGASQRDRLLAAGLVAVGPAMFLVSGYHGQIDSLAILPAVAAVWVWECRGEWRGRGLAAGLLIGLGASVKTVPLVVIFALLPWCRGPREAVTLIAAAAVVPLAALAPWLIAAPGATVNGLSYTGAPGVGGLGLLVQPNLIEFWLGGQPTALSGASEWLLDNGTTIAAVLLAVSAVVVARRRLEPAQAASVLWLVVYAFGVNFFFQYLVWGIPFFLMAGHRRAVVALQAVALPAAVMLYLAPWEHYLRAAAVYLPLAVGLWVALVVALLRSGRWARRSHGGPRPAAP